MKGLFVHEISPMNINSLHLINFRNFEGEKIEFGPQFNLLIGKNAQGKTNIIEALCILANGRSFRTSEFRDMIRMDGDFTELRSNVSGRAGLDELRVTLDRARKSFFRNGKKTTPGGFKGLNAVLFAPEEILLLRDSPSARRKYIDNLISNVVASYRGLVRSYERVISHRNRLLQEPMGSLGANLALFKGWDSQLVEYGARIIVERNDWCTRLNGYIPERYRRIAPEDGEATFVYRPHCGEEVLPGGERSVRDALLRELNERREDEFVRGFTLVGPHRDDLEARIAGAAVKSFGSQGQHRSFVLALKIAEIDLLCDALGETPILLLDDVASELDTDRNLFFFRYLCEARGQVFVTATDADSVKFDDAGEIRRFTIDSGRALPSV